jgi:hypothetical protein
MALTLQDDADAPVTVARVLRDSCFIASITGAFLAGSRSS